MDAERPIYFVRHGDYDESHPDDRFGRLNERGIAQAYRAAEALSDIGGEATLLSSSAARTVETAEIIGRVLGIEPRVSEELYRHGNFATEVLHTGDLEQLLGDALAESGLTFEAVDRLVVVNHMPLMGLVKGLRTGGVEIILNGEIVEYDPGTWIPLAEWSSPRRG
ncbi:MAG: histidine phosphatase family protein [bacterium]|nr:histidine phosphatase family protein [bacterium]